MTTTVRTNKYAARCADCGQHVPAGTGILSRSRGAWIVTHPAPRWVGSPVSGHWSGGCPQAQAVIDGFGPAMALGGFDGPGNRQPDPFRFTRSRGYYGRDAGKCEDAPCCGCC